MRLWGIVVFILTVLCVSISAESFFQDVKVDREKKVYQDYDGPVIYDTEEYRFTDKGELFETRHRLVYINTAQALGKAQVVFHIGDSVALKEYNVRLIKKDGTIKNMEKKHERQIIQDNRYGFDNNKALIVSMYQEVEIGDLIEWYSVYQVKDTQLGSEIVINTNEYIENFSAKVIIPTPHALKYYFHNKNIDSFSMTGTGGNNVYVLTRQDITPFISKSQVVLLQFPFYMLQSKKITLDTWEDFAHWIHTISDDKMIVTPDIKKKAVELTASMKTKREKIGKIYDYVRNNVRYVQAYLKDGGFVPHSADSIFKNKFGDCKDYAVLIITMLKAINIEACYTLVLLDEDGWNTDQVINSQFNHAIVFVPDEKEPMWLDGTSNALILGEPPQAIVNKYALIIGKSVIDKHTTESKKSVKEEPQLYHGLVVVKKQENPSDIPQTESKFYSYSDVKMHYLEENKDNKFLMDLEIQTVLNNTASGKCTVTFTNQYTQPFEQMKKSLSDENFVKYIKRLLSPYFNPNVLYDSFKYEFSDDVTKITFNVSVLNLISVVGGTAFLNTSKLLAFYNKVSVLDYDVIDLPYKHGMPSKGSIAIKLKLDGNNVASVHSFQKKNEFGQFRIMKDDNFVIYACDFDFGGSMITEKNITRFSDSIDLYVKEACAVYPFYRIKE